MMRRGKMTMNGFYWDDELIAPYHFVLETFLKVVDNKGEIVRKEYVLKAEFRKGVFTDCITVSDYKKIRGSDYWDQCVDADIGRKEINKLITDIQEQLAEKIEQKDWVEVIEFNKPGLFSVRGKYVYVKPNGVIIQSPDDYQRYLSFTNNSVQYCDSVDLVQIEKYLTMLIKFYPGVTDVLLLYIVLAHLKPVFIMMGVPVDAILALVGTSGSFKTTLANIGVCDDARFKFMTVKPSQLEKQLLLNTGSCVLVDDYKNAKQKYVRDRLVDVFDVLARIADSKKNAMVITTGEFLEGDFSFQDRLYQVFVRKTKREYTDEELNSLSELSRHRKLFEQFIINIEEIVYSDIPKVSEIIAKNKIRLHNNESGLRIDRNIGLLEIVLEILCELYPEGVFCEQKQEIMMSLKRLYEFQVKRMNRVYALEQDADWTLVFYEAYDHKFFPESFVQSENQQILRKDGFLYITPLALEEGLNRWLNTRVDSQLVVKDFEKKQILLRDKTKDFTVKLKNGIRYYRIDMARLKLYYDNCCKSKIGKS